MKIGQVIGNISLSAVHPTLRGARWVIAVPFSLQGLQNDTSDGEEIIVFDEIGSSPGAKIAFSEGAEAAAPFHPKSVPVDAYVACLIDTLELYSS